MTHAAERPLRFVPLAQPPSRHDLLYWLVDAALCAALLDGTGDDAPFAWDPHQPRDYRGRWSSGAGGGLSAADRGKGRAEARAAVDAFLKAGRPATDDEVKALAGHLARLTVAQLHELRRDYGLKGASALRKGELTDRLHHHVREAREKNRQEWLTGQSEETILPVESKEPTGDRPMATTQTGGMTEKQAAYHADLVRQAAPGEGDPNVVRKVVNYYLARHLPAPRTPAEASAQIDALKSGMVLHAKKNQEWARPVLEKLDAVLGPRGANLPRLLAERKRALSPEERMRVDVSDAAWRELVLDHVLGL